MSKAPQKSLWAPLMEHPQFDVLISHLTQIRDAGLYELTDGMESRDAELRKQGEVKLCLELLKMFERETKKADRYDKFHQNQLQD